MHKMFAFKLMTLINKTQKTDNNMKTNNKIFKRLLPVISALTLMAGATEIQAATYTTILGSSENYFTTSAMTESDGIYTLTKELDGITWNFETDGAYAGKYTLANVSGMQFGSTSKAISYVKLSTSEIPGTITSITVYAANAVAAEDYPVYLTITIGDETICESQELGLNTGSTTAAKRANVTNSFECSASGEIIIYMARTSSCAYGIFISDMEITYVPSESYTIDEESEDNGIVDSDFANVTVKRTFSPDYWNTLCLPFSVSESSIEDLFGEGTSLMRFTGVTDESTLNFSEADSIESGVPYLFKPAIEVEDPVFEEVTVSAEDPSSDSYDGFSFTGIYNATQLSTTDVFLGTDGSLYHPSSSSSALKGTRAYFTLPDGQDLSSARLMIGDEIVTGITRTKEEIPANDGVYNLQGIRTSGNLSEQSKGIYISNGKKIIIK